MCEQYGELCWMCKRGIEHEAPKPKARKGEFWRAHHSLALEVGADEVAKFEKHYAKHGINVTHRKTDTGGYEPVITRQEQFDAMLRSRGLHDRR
ncbi:hypothetical protein [Nitrospira sp. BLG_1]|uniref:hypothetical protein n=1 Tax=Nitrospira sp. BLG_1 TaxID=3395883 RepID=UPI0039BD7EC2